jgi:hypothetical protein
MWRDVLTNRRLPTILGKDVLPVMVCLTPEFIQANAEPDFRDLEAGSMRRHGRDALLELFGPNAWISTPQQLVLHGDGSVLWHGLRGHSLP